MTNTARGLLAGLVAAAIWGGMYAVSKAVLAHVPPFTLLAIRLLLALAVLALWLARRGWGGFRPSDWPATLLIGLLGYGLSLGLQFVGTRLSTASNGAVITSATPAFIFLFAWWLLGERIAPRRLLALVVATLGVLVVVDTRAARLAPSLVWGNLALAGAAVSWAWYSVLVRRATRRLATLPVTFVAFIGGLFIALPAAAWELSHEPVGPFTPALALGLLYLGIISTAVAAYLWNRALELLEAGVASLTFFAQPLVGTLLGIVFLGERLTPTFLLGGTLIVLGVALAIDRPPQPATPAAVKS